MIATVPSPYIIWFMGSTKLGYKVSSTVSLATGSIIKQLTKS